MIGQRVCALTVYGAWAEYFTREADDFVPVPEGLDDGEVVALILNYVTAYQMIHRKAAMSRGQTALVTGANGGVGTALLELLRVHGVRAIGAVSRSHFEFVRSLGGEPIARARCRWMWRCTSSCPRAWTRSSTDSAGATLRRAFARRAAEGSSSAMASWRAAEDWTPCAVSAGSSSGRGLLFELLAARSIQPTIAATLPLLAGREGERMLEAGGIAGKIVLRLR